MCNSEGKAIDLTIDHKPDDEAEKQRIEKAHGEINHWSVCQVRGLTISRSLGDYGKKLDDDVIIAKPDIFTYELDIHRPKFMILASNGLWAVMTNQEAVDLVADRYLNQDNMGATDLVVRAIELKSIDNITVLIIVFKNGHYEVGSANV